MEVSELWILGKLSAYIFFLIIHQGSDPWSLIRDCRFIDARRVINEELKRAKRGDLPELYYLSAIASEDLKSMVSNLKKVVEIEPGGRYNLLANLELAKIDYAYGDNLSASNRLKRLVKQCEDAKIKPEILFWLGLAQIDLPDRIGVQTLKKLILEFPTSSWSKRASAIIGISARRYSVQTGAFKTQKHAIRQRNKLKEYGFEVTVAEKRVGGDFFYRVLVGGFKTLDQGVRMVDSLRALGFSEARMVGY